MRIHAMHAMHAEYVLGQSIPAVVTFLTDSPPLSIDRNTTIQSGTCDAVGSGGVRHEPSGDGQPGSQDGRCAMKPRSAGYLGRVVRAAVAPR